MSAAEDVLRRVADGDPQALRELRALIGPRVRAVALKVTHDREDAEEVLQDVLMQVWRRAAGFDLDRGEVGAWVHVIARRRALDLVRARASRDRLVQAAEDDARTGGVDQAPAHADRDRIREVLALVPRLTRLQREAVVLVYLQELPVKVAAEQLHVPEGTLKRRLDLARRRLREAMEVGR